MKAANGTDYAQNYDLTVKLMANALKGQTLEVIGVKTGRITEVFGFEPTDISVRAGRVDVMVRDETGSLYHIEEQRNLKPSDLCRFAAYHFMGVKQWGMRITDLVLTSGQIFIGEKTVTTPSGRYAPVVIDFSRKEGKKRLEEIRRSMNEGTFDRLLELVFLPLYGKETGEARSRLVKEILRFQVDLFHMKKISPELLAAAMIMSNKMVEKEFFNEIWEEVKMLDIIDFAREKGIEEGKNLGIEEGRDIGIREGRDIGRMEGLLEAIEIGLQLKFGVKGIQLLPMIQEIQDIRRLDMIKKIIRAADDLSDVEASLRQARAGEGAGG